MIKQSLDEIKEYLLERYKNNLAGILIFGSANTGNYQENKSDIDTLIFLKENAKNREKEVEEIRAKLKSLNLSIHYLITLKEVQQVKTWSGFITIASKDGAITLYSTKEFEEVRKRLKAPSKEEIKKYILEKDVLELEGYVNQSNNFKLTKDIMSHIRRKLQIISYFKTKKLIFDYGICLNNSDLDKKEILSELYKKYLSREKINNKKELFQIARNLTKTIESI